VVGAVRNAIARYKSTPRTVTPWRRWAIRRALSPWLTLPCQVRASSTFVLGSDLVDDFVLEDVLGPLEHVYFPPELPRLASPLILQLGAHSGIVVVELLRRAPTGHVIAMEPSPVAVARLRHHLRINSVEHRCEVIERALGDRNGTVRLRTSREGSWGDSTYPGTNEASYHPGGAWVSASTLADVLRGRQPDIVLCNAEGAEFAFIPQLLALGLRPLVMVLMTHSRHGSVAAVVEPLRSHGFEVRQVGDNPEHLHCRPMA
jgi:FkbM family methyltransferase